MDTFRTKTSEISPVKLVRLQDGRRVRKLVDKSLLRGPRNGKDGTTIRDYIQLFFLAITVWIGVDFYRFVKGLETGATLSRPPGVDAFLPIGALMSIREFLITGIVNRVHPAGFFIFVAVVLLSALMKKGFCSWICPIGYLSETLHEFGLKIFRKKFQLPRKADLPLRSLKYVLFGFFLIAVSSMSAFELDSFIHSGYNKVADIKLFLFFTNISTVSLIVIVSLAVLSIFYDNFWCRYACPYGALLGMMSLMSPLKVRRDDRTCIDCGKCADVCPSIIPVDKLEAVSSAECTACYKCVEVCPIRATLSVSLGSRTKSVSQKKYAAVLLVVYFGIVGVAMVTGLWQNDISTAEYLRLFREIGTISHPF